MASRCYARVRGVRLLALCWRRSIRRTSVRARENNGRSLFFLRVHRRSLQQGRGTVHAAHVRRLSSRQRPRRRPLSGDDPRGDARRPRPDADLGAGAEGGRLLCTKHRARQRPGCCIRPSCTGSRWLVHVLVSEPNGAMSTPACVQRQTARSCSPSSQRGCCGCSGQAGQVVSTKVSCSCCCTSSASLMA